MQANYFPGPQRPVIFPHKKCTLHQNVDIPQFITSNKNDVTILMARRYNSMGVISGITADNQYPLRAGHPTQLPTVRHANLFQFRSNLHCLIGLAHVFVCLRCMPCSASFGLMTAAHLPPTSVCNAALQLHACTYDPPREL